MWLSYKSNCEKKKTIYIWKKKEWYLASWTFLLSFQGMVNEKKGLATFVLKYELCLICIATKGYNNF